MLRKRGAGQSLAGRLRECANNVSSIVKRLWLTSHSTTLDLAAHGETMDRAPGERRDVRDERCGKEPEQAIERVHCIAVPRRGAALQTGLNSGGC